ncbi:MAG: RHS repeat-associated core domain-containing protein [Chlamydiota bacterium]
MRKLIISWCCLLTTPILWADEVYDTLHPHVIPEELPRPVTPGNVDVVTGAYVESHTDIVIPGTNPLIFTRNYNNRNKSADDYDKGWDHNHLLKGYPIYNSTSSYLPWTKIYIKDDSGNTIKYDRNGGRIFFDDDSYGISNNSSGTLGARTNCRHNYAYMNSPGFILIKGSGRKLKFQQYSERHGNYLIKEQILPNGNKILYDLRNNGNREYLISKITTVSPTGKHLGWLQFEYFRNKHKTYPLIKFVTSSLGHHVQFNKPTGQCLAKGGPPSLDSTYGTSEPNCCYRKSRQGIIRVDYPDKRYLINQYEKMPAKDIENGMKFPLSKGYCYEEDRIQLQKAPVGSDETPIIIGKYSYKTISNKRKTRVDSGITTYTDALDNKILYHYRLGRLTRQEYYTPDNELESAKVFYWKGDTFVGYAIENSLGQALKAVAYTYDKYYNVTKETTYGNLSGQGPEAFGVDKECRPTKSVESYSKNYTYSKNGLNLILEEVEDNGNFVKYSYKDKTDLLTSKFIGKNSKVFLRYYYEYDDDATLIKTIVDDGTTKKITAIKPKAENPGITLPEVVEERDSNNKLLKKTVNIYDKKARIIRQDIYDSKGAKRYSLHTEYNDKGRPTMTSDAIGHQTHMKYDSNNNLIEKAGPRGKVFYSYDFSNRLICEKEVHPKENLSKLYRYDYCHNKTAEIDIYGNETRYEYDHRQRLIKTIMPTTKDEHSHQINYTITKKYDTLGNVCQVTDPNGDSTQTIYNSRSQPIKIIYPNGTKESFTYNLDGTLKQKTMVNGSTISFEYDYQRRVTEEAKKFLDAELTRTSYTYNGFGITSETDPMGYTSYYYYDAAGRVSSVVKGESRTDYGYDSLGRQHQVKEWYGYGKQDYRIKISDYDFLNRIVEQKTVDGRGNILAREQYTYDSAGNKTAVKTFTARGTAIKKFYYNKRHELIKIIDGENNPTIINYDHQQQLKKTTINPNGIKQIEFHNALGKVIKVVKQNPIGQTISLTESCYDGAGHKVSSKDTVYKGTKPIKQQLTAWQYGPGGRVEKVWENYGRKIPKIKEYIYDNYGRQSIILFPNGTYCKYDYDALGRLITQKGRGAEYAYQYDRNNNLIEVVEAHSGEKITRTHNALGLIAKEIQANGAIVTYGYDRLGRKKKVKFQEQKEINYSYDALHLKAVNYGKFCHTYDSYDYSGHLLQAHGIGKIGSINYQYDKVGRLCSIGSEEIVEYDSVGNVVHRVAGDEDIIYEYDNLNQLVKEPNHTYQYDSLNNRHHKDGKNYTVGDFNEILDDGDAHYQYDLNGNLTFKNCDHQITCYTYDSLNRLVKIVNADTEVCYTYDAFNRRTSKEVRCLKSNKSPAKTFFIYDGQNEVGAFDQKGKIFQFRALGLGKGAEIGATVAIEIDGKVYAPKHDFCGNIIALLDPANKVVESYSLSAFGEETLSFSPINPWRYASKRIDEESSLIFFGRRYYSPTLGRWITNDPKDFADGINLYAYVHNNPLVLFDLYGELSIREGLKKIWHNTVTYQEEKKGNYAREMEKRFHDPNYKPEKSVPQPLPDTTNDVSFNYEIGQGEVNDNVRVLFINGVLNETQGARKSAEMISALHGGVTVHGTFHSTGYRDFGRLAYHKFHLATVTTFNMIDNINNARAQMSENGKVIIYAHSHGGLITDRALEMLPKTTRDACEVYTFGSATMISKNRAGSAQNYVCEMDPIPFASDPIDSRKGKSRPDSNIEYLPGTGSKKTLDDHAFNSPAYQSKLVDLGRDFTKHYGEIIR